MNFFKTSEMPTFSTMWNFMSGPLRQEVMVSSNSKGIEKVIEEDGKYAYLMESSSIQYIIERNCKVTQIGGNLDNKGYGIPMKQGSGKLSESVRNRYTKAPGIGIGIESCRPLGLNISICILK